MSTKKLQYLALTLALAVGVCTGCGKGGDGQTTPGNTSGSADVSDTPAADGAMGRYAETDIPLPDSQAEPFGILWEDGALTLYTRDSDAGAFSCYRYENQAWSQPEQAAWLEDAWTRLDLGASYIYSGQDGKIYAMAYPNSQELPFGQYILGTEDGTTAEDLTPPSVAEPGQDGYREYLLDMAVLSDGTLALGMGAGVGMYQNNKQTLLLESIPLIMDHQTMVAASRESLAVYAPDSKSVDIYSTSNFEKLTTVATDQDLYESLIFPGENGVWYLVTQGGILRFAQDGSIVETIMAGTNGLMGSTSTGKIQFLCGDQEDFYGLYRNYSSGAFSLKYYSYHDDIPSSASTTLSIYGLQESSTISQAVYEFQNLHQEVQVQYNFATGPYETPSGDVIRSLNAELLNGSGADVLILDGLPIQSYMEKGILTDLSDLAGSLGQQGVLMDVIGNAASLGGKTYALPARIAVPLQFGSPDELKAVESLEALHSYVETHPDNSLLGYTIHDLAGMTLFHTMYEDLLLADGGLNEEKLTQFLEDWLQICQTANTQKLEELWEMNTAWDRIQIPFYSGYDMNKENYVQISQIDGVISSISPYITIQEKNLTPAPVRGYYVPRVLAGVNASSSSQELAKEFVELLFSDSIQGLTNTDGFPVSAYGLEAMMDYSESEVARGMTISSGSVDPETGEEYIKSGTYPPRERLEELVELIKGLDKPFLVESAISQTVWEEMERCYQGQQTPAEASRAICQKVSMYLAE